MLMAISIDFLLLAGEWAKCLQEIIEAITESSICADVILIVTTQRALAHRHNRHLYVYVCDWMRWCTFWSASRTTLAEESVWVSWRVHYRTESRERRLLSSASRHYSLCICGGVWMERCWHDTLLLWNIVNIALHVEQDILQYVVELKCLLIY